MTKLPCFLLCSYLSSMYIATFWEAWGCIFPWLWVAGFGVCFSAGLISLKSINPHCYIKSDISSWRLLLDRRLTHLAEETMASGSACTIMLPSSSRMSPQLWDRNAGWQGWGGLSRQRALPESGRSCLARLQRSFMRWAG